jgi:hypothetical protein
MTPQSGASIAVAARSVRRLAEHMFVAARRSYEWGEIGSFYDAGHTAAECQARFDISNGAWHAGRATRRNRSSRGAGTAEDENSQCSGRAVRRRHVIGCDRSRARGVEADGVLSHAQARRRREARAGWEDDWDAVREYYEAGHSAAACRKKFGFGRDAWADAIGRGVVRPRPQLEPIDAVLAVGRRRSRAHVKARLFAAGLKSHRCDGCGLMDWQGAPISLELHHVNGDGNDNRLVNLRLLCPNCHSQTDAWGGRNKARPAG